MASAGSVAKHPAGELNQRGVAAGVAVVID